MLPFHLPLDIRLNLAALQIFYIANATYPTSAGAIKLALLFQYLRIYERGTHLWYTTVGTIVIVFGVSQTACPSPISPRPQSVVLLRRQDIFHLFPLPSSTSLQKPMLIT